MILLFIHHADILTHFKKGVDFIWSTNYVSMKQTLVNLTKGNMHKIYFKGIQYATSYSSASIYINYPDPIIHVLDYYSDIIDSKRGEKRDERDKGDKGDKKIKEIKYETDSIPEVESESDSESDSDSDSETLSDIHFFLCFHKPFLEL